MPGMMDTVLGPSRRWTVIATGNPRFAYDPTAVYMMLDIVLSMTTPS